MSGFVNMLTGKTAAAQAAQQEGLAQSDQGAQLKLLSQQQATTDNANAALNGPNIGQALLKYQKVGRDALGG